MLIVLLYYVNYIFLIIQNITGKTRGIKKEDHFFLTSKANHNITKKQTW